MCVPPASFLFLFVCPVPIIYGDDEFDDEDDRHASSNFPHLPHNLPPPTHPSCTALRHTPCVMKITRTLFRAKKKRKGSVDWRRSRVRDEGPACHTKIAHAMLFFTLIEPIIRCRQLVVSWFVVDNGDSALEMLTASKSQDPAQSSPSHPSHPLRARGQLGESGLKAGLNGSDHHVRAAIWRGRKQHALSAWRWRFARFSQRRLTKRLDDEGGCGGTLYPTDRRPPSEFSSVSVRASGRAFSSLPIKALPAAPVSAPASEVTASERQQKS